MVRLIVAAPFLLVLVLFTLSNPQPVRLSFWPTEWSLEAPLSLVVLGAMAVAFLLGGLLVWLSVVAARRRARKAEREARTLDARIREMQARPQSARPVAALPEP